MKKYRPSHGGKRAGSGRKPPPAGSKMGRIFIGRIDPADEEMIYTFLTPAARKDALISAAQNKLNSFRDSQMQNDSY